MTTHAPLRLVLDGSHFHDIPGFYAAVNRVFMAGESWQIGPSLDALDDLLRGGYGAMQGAQAVDLHWRAFTKSRADLGPDATRGWLAAKLAQPGFNHRTIAAQLVALEAGTGQTYFEIILEIIASQPKIRLIPG